MFKFAQVFPDLLATLAAELDEAGKPQLASDLRESLVRSVSFDPDADAGTIGLNSR